MLESIGSPTTRSTWTVRSDTSAPRSFLLRPEALRRADRSFGHHTESSSTGCRRRHRLRSRCRTVHAMSGSTRVSVRSTARSSSDLLGATDSRSSASRDRRTLHSRARLSCSVDWSRSIGSTSTKSATTPGVTPHRTVATRSDGRRHLSCCAHGTLPMAQGRGSMARTSSRHRAGDFVRRAWNHREIS